MAYDKKKRAESIEKEFKDKPSFLKTIHGKLKESIITVIGKIIDGIDEKVESVDDLSDSELQRQYLAIERAVDKLAKVDKTDIRIEGRSNDAYKLMKKAYFTILSRDANWMKLSAYVFDEYRKIRGWK